MLARPIIQALIWPIMRSFVRLGASGGGGSDWIMDTGSWDDTGIWVDSDVWKDS